MPRRRLKPRAALDRLVDRARGAVGGLAPFREPGPDTSPPAGPPPPGSIRLFLAGDVMTGRAIDQVQRHPSDPVIYEPNASSALGYIERAEQKNGPIPRGVEPAYVWGDALAELAKRRPDVRVVNLETSITTSSQAEAKGINYRMHPANLGVLQAAALDCCVLANNHTLDWGRAGLVETVETLRGANIALAGAGTSPAEAAAPAVLQAAAGRRVLVFAFGLPTSGIPLEWAATPSRPGIRVLRALSDETCDEALEDIQVHRQPGDLVVVSLHAGSNWREQVQPRERRFAHRLIDSGFVDVVHGHSSHHPRGIEIYRDRPILYGCGDLINDYEGIGHRRDLRTDLVLGYFLTFAPGSNNLARLELVPFRLRRFRLEKASNEETAWLRRRLDRESKPLGARVEPGADGALELRW